MKTRTLLIAVLLLTCVPTVGIAQPDVIVGQLTGPATYGGNGSTFALAIGTTSCNIGTTPLTWIANSPVHPVIGQNMYRLGGGRFEMIGMSWLKHGFTALQQNLCGGCNPNPNGNALGVGCSDPYSAGLNGQQSGLGPRWEVNPVTGAFPYPYGVGMPGAANNIDRRCQIAYSDLDSASNPGALYFAEGQYIHPEDALANNDDNNASYRPISVSGNGGSYSFSWAGSTQQQQAAIYAWQANDPSVTTIPVDVPGDGRFIIAYKATPIAGGLAHYEFAIQNLNSDQGAGSVTINVACGGTMSNVGQKTIAHHSGEPWQANAWNNTTTANSTTWSTAQTFAQNQNDNALRWGTLFNYWFDATAAPSTLTIGLFKPGSSAAVTVNLGGGTLLPEYQTNGFSASLDINAVLSNGTAPAITNGTIGSTNNLNFFSFLPGQQWDLAYSVSPLVPRSACPLQTTNGQVLNLDLTDPAFGTWFGGGFNGGSWPFANFNVNFSFPVATSISAQFAIIAPNLADGIALSQGVRVVIN